MARVVVSEGGAERTVVVESSLLVVGADRGCGLVLTAADVAPLHCEIRGGADGWRVVDLESRAGTRVNGQFVNSRMLADGDVIEVGRARLAFHADVLVGPQAAAPAPAVQPAAAAQSGGTVRAPVRRPAATRAARHRGAEADAPEEDEQRRRRPTRPPTAPATALLVVAGLALAGFVAWLVVRASYSDTPNHAVRVRMADAQDGLRWQEVVDLARDATPDGSHDWTEIQAMVERARKALQGRADAERVEASNQDWVALRVWRQDNYTHDELYLTMLDDFLTKYDGLESEGVRQARSARVKLTGTSSPTAADTPDEAWKVALDDVHALEGDGRFGDAIAKVDQWWSENGSAKPAMNVVVEKERNRLHEAAEKWFGSRMAVAQQQWSRGEQKRAHKTIEEAARNIGLPGYDDRAMEALRTLQGR